MNRYRLLTGTGGSLGENFHNVFVTKANNPELIFIRDYDGSTDFPNSFTQWNIPRSMRASANFGAHVNPTLNQVESYELITSGTTAPDASAGDEVIVSMANESPTQNYNL